RPSPKKWRLLLATSWPLGLVLLLNAVYFRVDLLIISLFRPAAEVGWYGVAYRVVESALFIPAMLGGLLLPRFSEQDGKKKQRPAQYLEQGLKLLLLAAGLVVAILLVLNRPIITLLAGPGYEAAAPLLAMLSLALGTMFIGTTFGYALVALKQQTKLLKLYGALAIFNVIANLIFIPRYGAMAAASTTVVTELLATIVAGYFVWQLLPFRFPTRYFGQVVLASAGAILVLAYALPQVNLIIQLSAITASYLLLAGLAGLLSGRHFELLRYAQPK
ncbi:polysaccharide biosynthesis C-terminal domain-containing protein, partial [Patescibacteria group bacterium]|nr:polysaccharide biosynthesis C-terminal domain-containing protein [Patescibacteria group bacterium]